MFMLSFAKQISLQLYFTLYFVGLRLVKIEDRVSVTFLYIMLSNIGYLLGTFIGGLSSLQISEDLSPQIISNLLIGLLSLIGLILSFTIKNKDNFDDTI